MLLLLSTIGWRRPSHAIRRELRLGHATTEHARNGADSRLDCSLHADVTTRTLKRAQVFAGREWRLETVEELGPNRRRDCSQCTGHQECAAQSCEPTRAHGERIAET